MMDQEGWLALGWSLVIGFPILFFLLRYMSGADEEHAKKLLRILMTIGIATLTYIGGYLCAIVQCMAQK